MEAKRRRISPPASNPQFSLAVGAEPVSRVVVPLVGETHRDAVLAACPDFLDEPVIELAAPLAAQELLDGRAPVQKLRTVAPHRVLRVRERHALRIALFQASSAIRTLATALAQVKGGLMGATAAGAPGIPSLMSSPPSCVRSAARG